MQGIVDWLGIHALDRLTAVAVGAVLLLVAVLAAVGTISAVMYAGKLVWKWREYFASPLPRLIRGKVASVELEWAKEAVQELERHLPQVQSDITTLKRAVLYLKGRIDQLEGSARGGS